ncbi:MAG: site-2 protease family protein [Candidatus Sungbacteria bacterium]|nr:site-2 protease family protein [Candidatus Sungbacteria bacterium]
MAIDIIFIILVYFFSIVMHEVSHGFVAYALGDPTAKDAGRLTLNPLAHIDPFGTVILPLLMALPAFLGARPLIFGWAKPVPFNPMYFKNIRKGTFLVAIAGVGANFLIAVIFALILRALPGFSESLGSQTANNLATIFSTIIIANLVLGIFNCFPIPPLDGSKVLFSVLPESFVKLQIALERYGIFLLLAIIFLLPEILGFLVTGAFNLLVD